MYFWIKIIDEKKRRPPGKVEPFSFSFLDFKHVDTNHNMNIRQMTERFFLISYPKLFIFIKDMRAS